MVDVILSPARNQLADYRKERMGIGAHRIRSQSHWLGTSAQAPHARDLPFSFS